MLSLREFETHLLLPVTALLSLLSHRRLHSSKPLVRFVGLSLKMFTVTLGFLHFSLKSHSRFKSARQLRPRFKIARKEKRCKNAVTGTEKNESTCKGMNHHDQVIIIQVSDYYYPEKTTPG